MIAPLYYFNSKQNLMPLLLTGLLNNTVVENKIVTAQQIIDLVGLPIEIGKPTIFDNIPNPLQATSPNGAFARPSGMTMPPVVNFVLNGNSYTVRYYQSKTKNASGEDVFVPNRVRISGGVGDVVNDPEVAVILCLQPACADSPVAGFKTYEVSKFEQKLKATVNSKVSNAQRIVSLTQMSKEDREKLHLFLWYKKQLGAAPTTDAASTLNDLIIYVQENPDSFDYYLADNERKQIEPILFAIHTDAIKVAVENNRRVAVAASGQRIEINNGDNHYEAIVLALTSLPNAELQSFLKPEPVKVKAHLNEAAKGNELILQRAYEKDVIRVENNAILVETPKGWQTVIKIREEDTPDVEGFFAKYADKVFKTVYAKTITDQEAAKS